MIDLELSKLGENIENSISYSHEIGLWLDQNMPNPPLPEPQRWSIGYSIDGRAGIQFANNEDATFFLLRWS
jgi:hypothetical protein